jgi:hypothetical protein
MHCPLALKEIFEEYNQCTKKMSRSRFRLLRLGRAIIVFSLLLPRVEFPPGRLQVVEEEEEGFRGRLGPEPVLEQ